MGDGGPIVGHEYLTILDRERPPLFWDEAAAEHMATFKLKEDPSKKEILVSIPNIDLYGFIHPAQELGQREEAFCAGMHVRAGYAWSRTSDSVLACMCVRGMPGAARRTVL